MIDSHKYFTGLKLKIPREASMSVSLDELKFQVRLPENPKPSLVSWFIKTAGDYGFDVQFSEAKHSFSIFHHGRRKAA